MVLMTLDHVRDFFHNKAMLEDPLDLSVTTPLIYFTRWVTHFCAPVFVFLSGLSAYLAGQRRTTSELSKFLITRGLWLILIEFTVVTFGWTFNPAYPFFIMQVIWAIGASMLVLGLLVWLPSGVILLFSLTLIGFHHVLDLFENRVTVPLGFFWDLMHHGHFTPYPAFGNHQFLIVYPFIPWVGIMGVGYWFGKYYTPSFAPAIRKRTGMMIGIASLALFLIIRYINLYGDPKPWSVQESNVLTWLSFLDITKYPPSLLFTLIMLGPAFLFLAFYEKADSSLAKALVIFGKVPFFYYLIHIYAIHLLTLAVFFITGHTLAEATHPDTPFLFRPKTFGYGLPMVYLIWLAMVTCLYFPCRWFNRIRSTKKSVWWSYL